MKNILISAICAFGISCISPSLFADISKSEYNKWCAKYPYKCQGQNKRVQHRNFRTWCQNHPQECQARKDRYNDMEFLEDHR